MSRNVPKLRFKGFEDEWKKYELDDIAMISKSKYNPTKSNKTYKCIELEHIAQEDGRILGYVNSKEQNSIKNKFDSGDILFGKLRPYLKKYWISNFEGVCSSEIWVLKARKISNSFLYRIVQSEKFNNIANVSSGSKMPRADWNYMSSTIFLVPKLNEQEKIANFLSKVDSIIEKQEKKVQYWNSYKKGMMQKIFSQKIRFKDGNGMDYPEWEKKNLKYVLSEISEKTKENNQYEVLSSTANGVFKQSEYFNREIASADNTGYKILRLNQIVLSPQNLWLGNINYNNKYDMGIVSPSYKIFNINKNLNEKYISYIIKTDRMLYGYKQASEQGASVVRRNLNMDLFYDILINIPCVEEQEKIANFLSNIDNIIEKESKKLEELKQWKKGLLQQLFV
ncbi:restriction endonuclease subunit S [Clostridium perfringens]|nr:restriction endonuclease subunit S [Clostridium perfringens]MDU1016243.1 restriction endonuclease subunit S [Clostridium perfringens]MDU2748024.1 restriction endonuclease subunit S [Clostridium perfringens]MDU2866930.1 restriction endonuclease subunit S [Clostridium perfringens]MDU3597972.1 restriction endonuclease subunit S [Clostridium perfringens]MDU7583842.1 restriction endonuclease subunit S [Clostridium perfringens]